jgi:hypothetical protein
MPLACGMLAGHDGGRVGLQTGDAEYALVKRMAPEVSLSVFGVSCSSAPDTPSSLHPGSSASAEVSCAAEWARQHRGKRLQKQAERLMLSARHPFTPDSRRPAA